MSETIFISSNVELNTFVFGWWMYDKLWELLQSTGLAFLPFLGMIINNFIQPITATYTTSAAQLSLKKMEWDLIRMLVVIALAGQPFMEISLMKYQLLDLCKKDANGEFVDRAALRETAAALKKDAVAGRGAFGQTNGIEKALVPLWWYAVLSVSTGFTEAAKAAVPCVNDFRNILMASLQGSSQITSASLTSLNAEIQLFKNICYGPAALHLDNYVVKSGNGTKFYNVTAATAGFDTSAAAWFREKIEEGGDTIENDTASLDSAFFSDMGYRKEDDHGDGWESEGAAGKAIYGRGYFYDKLIEMPNWNGNGKPATISCRQWWGFGGKTADPMGSNAVSNAGRYAQISNLVREAPYTYETSTGFMSDTDVIDKVYKYYYAGSISEDLKGIPTRDKNLSEIGIGVVRQLQFRIFVQQAVATGRVVFRQLPNTGGQIYVSQDNYGGLALSKILGTCAPTSSCPLFAFVRLDKGPDESSAVAKVADEYKKHNGLSGRVAVRKLIQKYAEDSVNKDIAKIPAHPGGGPGAGFSDTLKKGIGALGLMISYIGTQMTAYVARESFPYVQALLLCGVYAFLSLGLVFAGYTLEFMYAGAMGIFTLKFVGFIFYLCAWLDNNLIVLVHQQSLLTAVKDAATPGAGVEVGMAGLLFGPLGAVAAVGAMLVSLMFNNFEGLMIDFATAGLYFTLPALFATVMVWAGVKGAEAIGEMQKAQQPLTQAGEKGAQMAQQMAGKAAAGVVSGVGGLAGAAGGAIVGGISGTGAGKGALRGAGLGKFTKP